MRTFSVSARLLAPIEVTGENWIVALGKAFERLGIAEEVGRLACEGLPNGDVIARDVLRFCLDALVSECRDKACDLCC